MSFAKSFLSHQQVFRKCLVIRDEFRNTFRDHYYQFSLISAIVIKNYFKYSFSHYFILMFDHILPGYHLSVIRSFVNLLSCGLILLLEFNENEI